MARTVGALRLLMPVASRRSMLSQVLRAADVAAVAALLIAVYMVGVRVSDSSETAGERTNRAVPQARAGDRDGDGVKDGADLEPDRAGPQAQAEPTTTPFAVPKASVRGDCRSKRINLRRGEGSCYAQGGRRLKVVNKARQLSLEEMDVGYRGVRLARRLGSGRDTLRPKGIYVVLTLDIANKLNYAADFNAGQVQLILGASASQPEPFADRASKRSLELAATGLRPGRSATGTVVFDVSRRFARRFDDAGFVRITQFSDRPDETPSQTVGFIRAYR